MKQNAIKRLEAKTPQTRFLRVLEHEYHFAPRIAQGILDEAEACLQGHSATLAPGQVRALVAEQDAGSGRPLAEIKMAEMGKPVLVHSHCHERAVCGVEGANGLLQLLPEAQVQQIDAGCCGMVGSFGFEKEHYEFSLAVGEGRLFPAVRAADAETEIVQTGMSCRDQVEHATGRRVRHPISNSNMSSRGGLFRRSDLLHRGWEIASPREKHPGLAMTFKFGIAGILLS